MWRSCDACGRPQQPGKAAPGPPPAQQGRHSSGSHTVPLVSDEQEDGLQRLRLLAPQLLAGAPHHLLRRQQQQQHVEDSQLLQQLLDVAPAADGRLEDELYHTKHSHQQLQQQLTAAAHRTSSSRTTKSSMLHPKQLMASIQAAGSVAELQALYQQHRSSLDPLAVACMLNRLAHTCANDTKAARTAAKQQQTARRQQQHRMQQQQQELAASTVSLLLAPQSLPSAAAGAGGGGGGAAEAAAAPAAAAYAAAVQLLQSLLGDFRAHLPAYTTRQLSSTLWVVGRFSRAAAGCADIQQVVAEVLHTLLGPAASSTQQQQQQQQQSTLPQLHQQQGAGDCCQSHSSGAAASLLQQQGNAADSQNTLWALGRLAQVLDVHSLLPRTPAQQDSSSSSGGGGGSSLLSQLDVLCAEQLSSKRCDGQFVANCLYGFAHLRAPAPALFEALVARANPNYCKSLQSQHVVVIIWAASSLGHHQQQLYDRLLWRAVIVRGALYPQGVAMLLSACARVRHTPDPRAVAQLLQVCKAQWWKLRGQHLSNLVWGLMGTNCLQHHSAFFMGVLLCQVTVKLHELQPLGVATVLQALLQVSRAAQHGTARLGSYSLATNQPSHTLGVTDPAGSPHSSSSSSSSRDGGGVGGRPQGGTVHQRLWQQQGLRQNSSSSSSSGHFPRPGVSPAAAARAQIGLSAALSGPQGDTSSQLALLLRQMGVQVVAQLPQTTPQTLYNIIISLAGVGYYEPRLYSRLAAAAAAAVAAGHGACDSSSSRMQGGFGGYQPQQQQRQQGGCAYSTQQCLQLLAAFSRHQHEAPELQQQLLPLLAADAPSLTHQQLTLLLTAGTAGLAPAAGGASSSGSSSAGAAGEQQLHLLLQLADAALQRQQGLPAAAAAGGQQLHRLVNLAAACATLVAADQQQQGVTGADVTSGSGRVLLQSVHSQAQQLLGQLCAAVCAQPQSLPWSSLLKLLHAVLTMQGSTAGSHTQQQQQQQGDRYSITSSGSSSGSHAPGWQGGGCYSSPRTVQQLAQLVQDHPNHWPWGGGKPQDLLLLLQCATHPAMLSANSSTNSSSSSSSGNSLQLADAYARELQGCLDRCSVQDLVGVLQVMAAAWQQQGEDKYGNVGLVAAAARQLHSKVRGASRGQLAAAAAALEALHQQQSPMYRTAARLLAPEPAAAAAGHQVQTCV